MGPGGKPTFSEKPNDCTPTEASLCMTTSSFGTTVSNGATLTTNTEVLSTCATITGCDLRDEEATTTTESCAASTAGVFGRRDESDWWDCDPPLGDAIILPVDPTDAYGNYFINYQLDSRKSALGSDAGAYEVFTVDDLDFTAYFFVKGLGKKGLDFLNDKESMKEVRFSIVLGFRAIGLANVGYVDQPGVLLRI